MILDLDETLVHSSFRPHDNHAADIELPVEIDGKNCPVFILVRPGAIEFCEKMSKHYEVVIFTASLSKYADPLVKILDKNNSWCSYILFREHCSFMEEQDAYVKDLSRLGRDLKDVIIIDNSPTSYYLQPENALASKSWYDEYDDRELFNFMPLLEQMSTFPDVRPVLTQIALEACDQIGRDIVVLIDIATKIVSK